MIFDLFEDMRFLKIFCPTTQIFKNMPRVVEISAHLKNYKNKENKYERTFKNPGAYF